MGAIAFQITSLTIVYSTAYSDVDQRKHQRGPVNSPHKGPVTRKMFPFDDVIMYFICTGAIIPSDHCPITSETTLQNMGKSTTVQNHQLGMGCSITTTKQSKTKPCLYFMGHALKTGSCHDHIVSSLLATNTTNVDKVGFMTTLGFPCGVVLLPILSSLGRLSTGLEWFQVDSNILSGYGTRRE